MKVERWHAGFWKVFGKEYFANVRKDRKKRQWTVDIRNNSGALIRYAGIWKSKREAVDEALFVLGLMER